MDLQAIYDLLQFYVVASLLLRLIDMIGRKVATIRSQWKE